MIIGIDARPLGENQPTGISYYLTYMLKAFELLPLDEARFILYAHKPFSFESRLRRVESRTGNGTLPGSIWVQTALPFLLAKDRPDIFWGPVQVLPAFVPRGCARVLTVHDLVFSLFPETMSRRNLWITRTLVPFSIGRADAVITDALSTARDLERAYPRTKGKITVISPGARPEMRPEPVETARQTLRSRCGIDYPFFLTVGACEPRKNFETVYRAFEKLAGSCPCHWVLAGPRGWKTGRFRAQLTSGPLRGRIHFAGHVDDGLLRSLYSAAVALVYPSLYEGFGLPLLEAMACGCPAISSNAASLPEICGDAVPMVEPRDARSLAALMERAWADSAWRQRCVERGYERVRFFDWRAAAQNLLNLFSALNKTGA